MTMRTLLQRAVLTAAAAAMPAGGASAGLQAGAAPRVFATPAEAAGALITACASNDEPSLAALFGEEGLRLIETADSDENRLNRRRFAEACERSHRLERNGDGSVSLLVGDDGWPFPVPLVPVGSGWRFDAAAGAQELLGRRIGRNELEALASLRAWLAAQAEYATADHDGDGVREYAQRLVSGEGLQDGLYWPVAEGSGEPVSPLGPLVLAADPDYVATRGPGKPWHGYRMKVLTGQGRHAPGGAHSYVINGNMIAGCALVAWPAEYGRTGIMTFLVSHHGTIWEKDLGPDTASVAGRLRRFDPGPGWREVRE